MNYGVYMFLKGAFDYTGVYCIAIPKCKYLQYLHQLLDVEQEYTLNILYIYTTSGQCALRFLQGGLQAESLSGTNLTEM